MLQVPHARPIGADPLDGEEPILETRTYLKVLRFRISRGHSVRRAVAATAGRQPSRCRSAHLSRPARPSVNGPRSAANVRDLAPGRCCISGFAASHASRRSLSAETRMPPASSSTVWSPVPDYLPWLGQGTSKKSSSEKCSGSEKAVPRSRTGSQRRVQAATWESILCPVGGVVLRRTSLQCFPDNTLNETGGRFRNRGRCILCRDSS